MAEFIAHNIAPIMFASLVVFLLLGYPVAFALAGCGLFYFVVGVELAPLSGGTIHLDWVLLQTLPGSGHGGPAFGKPAIATLVQSFFDQHLKGTNTEVRLVPEADLAVPSAR